MQIGEDIMRDKIENVVWGSVRRYFISYLP